MSSAVLRIQVATLADVPDGESRIDGVPNQVVTVRSLGTGSTHDLVFWDVCNPGVAGATVLDPEVPTLTIGGDGRSWTFTPPGGGTGFGQSFGLELVVDRGLATEVKVRRMYAIPTENAQRVFPLFAEGADPQASLQNAGATQVGNSVDNHDGNWRGYHPKLVEWMRQVEDTASLEARMTAAEADIVALEAADVALDARLDTAEADIVALDARLDTAETDIAALEAADVALDARLDTAEASLASLDFIDVGLYFDGLLSGSDILIRYAFTISATFPAGLASSRASAEVAATAEKIFSIQKNGVEFGTITFAAASSTGTFAAASPSSFVAGDVLKVVGPAADATLAGISTTVRAARD